MIMIMGVCGWGVDFFFPPFVDTDDDFLWGLDGV